MLITKVFRRLLSLQAVRVSKVRFHADALTIIVDVESTYAKLKCPRCGRRSDVGTYDSRRRLWRHIDLGPWEIYLRSKARRFHCHRCVTVVTEAVPWAEPNSTFSRDFEDVVSFYAQTTNQTVVSRVMKIAWASRSRLRAFVKLARTIRAHQDGILAAIKHGLSNGRLEGLNSKIHLLSHRAFGFHSAAALLALVYLCCAGIDVPLPSDRRSGTDPYLLTFPDP